MKVLVIGSGGREHALGLEAGSKHFGIKDLVHTREWRNIATRRSVLAGNLADVTGLAGLAEKLGADLTVVGPEQPLVDGIADEFTRRKSRIVGPSSECAQLEGSKIFAKEFLNRHEIPTARTYGTFASASESKARLKGLTYPLVTEGRRALRGKGVLVGEVLRRSG